MRSWVVLALLLSSAGVHAQHFCGRLLQNNAARNFPKYDYTNHGDDWGCRGVRQSPIAIHAGMLTPLEDSPVQMTLKEVKNEKMNLTIIRSAGGVLIDGPDLRNFELAIDGETLTMIGFHFHAASEHTLVDFVEEGKTLQGDAEIHFVFMDANDTPAAVLGAVLIAEEGSENKLFKQIDWAEADGKPHQFYANFTEGIFKPLTDNKRYGFATYPGSLTTPSCGETIRWFVTAAKMSKQQAAYFDCLRSIPGGGNYRHTQDLTCREVQTANLRLI